MSISDTYANHSMEKSLIILLLIFCFFLKRDGALEELWGQLGDGFFLLKEGLSQGVSSWSLLTSLAAEWLAR